MRKIYQISFGLLTIASVGSFVCVGCNIGPNVEANTVALPTPTSTPKKVQTQDNRKMFEDLRRQALAVKAQDLKINLSAKKVSVYGVVMDWDMPEGVATTIAFSTGDASLYNSAGGGVIGGFAHKNVENAAKELLRKADGFVARASLSVDTPLPKKDCVRFYLLTNKGIYTFEEKMTNFENETSAWYPFFEEVNKVITELTIISGTN